MQQQSIAQAQQQALSLNSTDKPYLIKTEANKIIGTWNVLDAKWLGIINANQADKDYSLTIELDEANHQYSISEVSKDSQASVSTKGFSFESNSFKGKQFGVKSGGAVFGFGMKNKGEPTKIAGVATYNFDVNQIKQPLASLLQQAGWTEKKTGLFKKLFGN